MQAVILSAGSGLRMLPIGSEVPKSFVEINGHPVIEYQLNHLRKFDLKKAVVTIRRQHEEKTKDLAEKFGIDVVFSVEDEIVGTAGGLKRALEFIDDENVLVLNTDDIADVNVSSLQELGSPVISVTSMKSAFGIVNVVGINTLESRVISFTEKPTLPYFTSIGWYYLHSSMDLPEKGMLEDDVFPQLAENNHLKAYYHHGYWVTVNTQKDIKEAEQCLTL